MARKIKYDLNTYSYITLHKLRFKVLKTDFTAVPKNRNKICHIEKKQISKYEVSYIKYYCKIRWGRTCVLFRSA